MINHDHTEAELETLASGYGIQTHLVEGLHAYIRDGRPTGGFLRAVLENNLKEAVGRADAWSMAQLKGIVSFCYNELPSTAWGSEETVDKWLKAKAELRRAQ